MTDSSLKIIELTFYFLIFFIGLPHGASDLLVIHNKWGAKKSYLIALIYFILFLSAALLWRNFSNTFFTILWLVSLLHFFDVEKKMKKIKKQSFEDIAFFSLFTLPILKSNEFLSYMKLLNGIVFHSLLMETTLIILVIQFILISYSLQKSIRENSITSTVTCWLGVGFSTYYLDLISSFLFIFIFIHSLRHLRLSFFNSIITKHTYISVILPISFITMGFIYYLKIKLGIKKNDYIFLIIGLGCLSIPHYFLELCLNFNDKK